MVTFPFLSYIYMTKKIFKSSQNYPFGLSLGIDQKFVIPSKISQRSYLK